MSNKIRREHHPQTYQFEIPKEKLTPFAKGKKCIHFTDRIQGSEDCINCTYCTGYYKKVFRLGEDKEIHMFTTPGMCAASFYGDLHIERTKRILSAAKPVIIENEPRRQHLLEVFAKKADELKKDLLLQIEKEEKNEEDDR